MVRTKDRASQQRIKRYAVRTERFEVDGEMYTFSVMKPEFMPGQEGFCGGWTRESVLYISEDVPSAYHVPMLSTLVRMSHRPDSPQPGALTTLVIAELDNMRADMVEDYVQYRCAQLTEEMMIRAGEDSPSGGQIFLLGSLLHAVTHIRMWCEEHGIQLGEAEVELELEEPEEPS